MRAKGFSIIILLVLLVGSFGVALNIQPVNASSTIYIRADGTIDPPTANINNVGNNLYIFTGNISDNIIVERNNIILDGAGYTLQNPDALVLEEYFDLNPPSSDPLVELVTKNLPHSIGVLLFQVNDVTIKNMHIRGFPNSILIGENSNNNIIYQNFFTTTKYPTYISSEFGGISSEFRGVFLNYSSNNRIYDNNFFGIRSAVYLNFSSQNTIYLNTIEEHWQGIWLVQSNNNIINRNTMMSETGSIGIVFEESSFNTISGNNISAWYRSVSLEGNNNTFMENTMNYYLTPVVLSTSSFGIGVENNKFYHNNFFNGTERKGKIPVTGFDKGALIFFDDGYPSGGNYWNDTVGVDHFSGVNQDQPGSDGIIDVAKSVGGTIFDSYPFLDPNGWVSSSQVVVPVGGGQEDITLQSNAVISDVVATRNNVHCTVSGPSGQRAFVTIAVPLEANTTNLKIFVNGTKLVPPPFPIISTNGTHYFVYFELMLSTHDIKIEFASLDWFSFLEEWLPYIALITGISIVALIIIYRKKYYK